MVRNESGTLLKKMTFYLVIILLVANICAPIFAEDIFEKYFSLTDVKKVLGISGVEYYPKNLANFMGGDLNFIITVKGKKQMLFAVNFETVDKFALLKGNYFKAALNGIGDEAFTGKNTTIKTSDRVVFRKGEFCVNIMCGKDWDAGGKTRLTVEQMTKIAKVIASRIKK